MLSKQEIAGLRELLARATPGPWQSMNEYQWDSIIGAIDGPDDGDMHYEDVADITSRHDRSRANAAAIVAAVNALPALLDIAEAVQWQPIETAPRNGLSVIWGRAGWSSQQGHWANGPVFASEYDSDAGYLTPSFQPTHWMPLPKPPMVVPCTGGGE